MLPRETRFALRTAEEQHSASAVLLLGTLKSDSQCRDQHLLAMTTYMGSPPPKKPLAGEMSFA